MRLLLLAVGTVFAGPQSLPVTPVTPSVVTPADHGTPLVAPPDLCRSVRCVVV